MIRIQEEIEVWGTIVFVDATSTRLNEKSLRVAIDEVRAFTHHVDEVFSTYKQDSVISKLRRSEISIDGCSLEVIEVWNACANAKYLSDGAFDPWKVAGGFDPSGYVKGWAADLVSEQLIKQGAKHIQVNAGGDISVRGGKDANTPWKLAVAHPSIKGEISKLYSITTGAIATSGSAERGDHIIDPHSKTVAVGARSATVIGPDAGISDALATALVVSGRDGASWFAKEALLEYSCWVVDRHTDTTWEILRK